jgi:hypothetical protein
MSKNHTIIDGLENIYDESHEQMVNPDQKTFEL